MLSSRAMAVVCPYCSRSSAFPACITRSGFFRRNCDGAKLIRYKCRCKRYFSTATFDNCYRQKKRHLNKKIAIYLASSNSQRRVARNLGINKNTVAKKFLFVSVLALEILPEFNLKFPRAKEIQFDDLETFEHTKLKPLSVTLAVEEGTRRFLGFAVSEMPAKGRLAYLSRKKYGRRIDRRSIGRKKLFSALKEFIEPNAVIKSDQNPHYPKDIKTHFPKAVHVGFKGQRGSTTGQGELKKVRWDPLFSLNHTCAKMRADINRLFRKTWCTTKRRDYLVFHIALFANYHNESLKKLKPIK